LLIAELNILEAFPCRSLATGQDLVNVEMDPQSEIEVREAIKVATKQERKERTEGTMICREVECELWAGITAIQRSSPIHPFGILKTSPTINVCSKTKPPIRNHLLASLLALTIPACPLSNQLSVEPPKKNKPKH
jgi:hypothetical protein